MRSKSQALMDKICDYVNDYYRVNHKSPSINIIAKAVNVSKTTAYRYLVEMNDKGILSYDGKTIETSNTDKCVTGYFSAPIVGSVRCGDPETEEESVEEYVSLPTSIFGTGEFYILRAIGDSMIDAGIHENDLVLIKKQSSASVGDIVVALDENNENTLKTYAGIDEDSQHAILRYENKEVYPDKVIKVKKLVVQGVAVNVIKKL
ncbi:MAG: repressor LexA [Clostridia bacterium]|nr:repressor LexA [Clostridia bacterium]